MAASDEYRSNAESCLRMAQTVHNLQDKPFWLTVAQSWLQLAGAVDAQRRRARTLPPGNGCALNSITAFSAVTAPIGAKRGPVAERRGTRR